MPEEALRGMKSVVRVAPGAIKEGSTAIQYRLPAEPKEGEVVEIESAGTNTLLPIDSPILFEPQTPLAGGRTRTYEAKKVRPVQRSPYGNEVLDNGIRWVLVEERPYKAPHGSRPREERPFEDSLPKRSACDCACHQDGSGVMHVVPCCEPDAASSPPPETPLAFGDLATRLLVLRSIARRAENLLEQAMDMRVEEALGRPVPEQFERAFANGYMRLVEIVAGLPRPRGPANASLPEPLALESKVEALWRGTGLPRKGE